MQFLRIHVESTSPSSAEFFFLYINQVVPPNLAQDTNSFEIQEIPRGP